MSFKDKVVLVTGASSGIGAATAIAFAGQGAIVAIVGRNEAKLKTTSEECEKTGKKPLVILADLTKDEDIKRIIIVTIHRFGKLDVLVNNAGMMAYSSVLAPNAMEVFDSVMSTNLRSVAYLTHLAAPYLIESKGNIVNVSSIAGLNIVAELASAYHASKAGLDHFTRSVALELASKGVRVNCVNPGPVRTDIMESFGVTREQRDAAMNSVSAQFPLGRCGEPEEIADVILFLASDKARSITGSTYVSDNGMALVGVTKS